MRKPEEGESVDSFITDLYALAEHCGYNALHDEMIRDWLVVGLPDASLSEKLQLNAELNLITRVHQDEAVKKHQSVLRGEGAVKPEAPVGTVHKARPRRSKPPPGTRQRGEVATTRNPSMG